MEKVRGLQNLAYQLGLEEGDISYIFKPQVCVGMHYFCALIGA